jgi:hypothetical protein
MDDFDAIIGQAKRIVGASRNLAADTFPNGAVLGCKKCRFTQRATREQCARYFSTGWPTHCGATMTADEPAPTVPPGESPNG